MKKRIVAFVCVLALLLGTPIASVEAASVIDTYQVGFSKVDITPTIDPDNLGLAMGGYGDTDSRKATTIMTPQFLKAEIAAGNSRFSKATANAIPDNANPNMYHLYASCIAVTDQVGTTVLLMTLDVIGVSSSYSSSMRKAVSEATGIPEENITITHTHTHSAPAISSSSSYSQIDTWRRTLVTNGLVQAAKEALASRSAATMHEGSVNATSTASVRHYYTSTESQPMLDDEGRRHVEGSNFGSIYGSGLSSVKSADEDMYLLMFKMEDSGKRDIVLCNYRVHPCRDSSSTVFTHDKHEGYTAISSDYIGPMRDALEQAGYDFAYFQGSAGNMATKGNLPSYQYGTKLAEYALSGLSGLRQVETGPIQTLRVDMPATTYQPVEADIEPAKKVKALYTDLLDGDPQINDPALLELFNSAVFYKKAVDTSTGKVVLTKTNVNDTYAGYLKDGVISATEAHNLACRLAWSYGLGSRYHANNIVSNLNNKETKTLQLNAFTLGGDIAIVTDPNEIFDDLTQDLADYYGKRTFVFGYTNGSNGYLPNDDAFYYNATRRPDGTMAYGGSYETHVTDFAMGTGAKVAATMKTMLDSMQVPSFCPCLGAHTDESDCNVVTWEPWTSTTSLPAFGNYYLTGDVTVTAPTQLQGKLNLDLNGKTVTGANGIFTASSGDHLTVTDSYTGGQLGISGVPVIAYPESKLTVFGTTIGGTVKVDGGHVTLGGTPKLFVNLSSQTDPMDCTAVQTGADIYVVAPGQSCFATVQDATQAECFTVQNDCSIRFEDNQLYLTTKQLHCVCNGKLSGLYGHVCEQVSWQSWTKTDSLPTETGNYYLTSTVYLDREQVIADGATVRLDLNGKTVYAGQVLDANGKRVASDTRTRAYYVPGGSTLEITSSTGSGTINGEVSQPATTDRSGNGGVIHAAEGSILRLYNGTIEGNNDSSSQTYPATAKLGGSIYAAGEFTMYNGTVRYGRVVSGKGGNIYTNGTFSMYGGTVTSGVGSGFNIYIAAEGSAHFGGTAYVKAGISAHGKVALSGTPNIPSYTDSSNNLYHGINLNSSAPAMDVSALQTGATVEISAKADQVFATGANAALVNCFQYAGGTYGVRCDADGNLYLYDPSVSRYGCICGGKLTSSEDHTCDPTTKWLPWTATDSLPAEGNYYLTSNVTVSVCTAVASELNLDLNGYVITATGSQRVFDVGDDKALRITDSRTDGGIDASGVTFQYEYTYANLANHDNHGGVIRLAKGTFELYGGTLTGPKNVARGGILYALGTGSSQKATVNIFGGTMTGGEAVFGGGVYLANATFRMYGGTIADCSAGRGGNIYHSSSTTVDINDGIIRGGTASLYDYFEADETTGEYTVAVKGSALGGNIYAANGVLYVDGGVITGGTVTGNNGNGGNLAICSSSTCYIRGGKVSGGSASNMGSNIYVSKKLQIYGGEICDPIGSYNIGLWNKAEVYISNGKVSGGTYAIYNGTKGGKTTLAQGADISGSSYGIFINDSYNLNTETGLYEPDASRVHSTVVVDRSFTGSASVYWSSDTFKALGIAESMPIANTTAKYYTGTGHLICENLNAPLVGSAEGTLVISAAAITDGDGTVSHHATFEDALAAYEAEESADQKYIMLYKDLAEIHITKDVYLDLNGHDVSVASVAEGCKIYAMDSITNQYTHLATDGSDLCGKLTLATGVESSALAKDVCIYLTKGEAAGTRKYLTLANEGEYTFHRYYLTLNEAGLRPKDAGIFYNAEFYGDEAVAAAVTKYGVEVSAKETFAAGSTAASDYQATLGAFQPGTVGNYGFRTVLMGILSENGAAKVKDYSNRNIYGRAYITLGDHTVYCSNVGSTSLQSILKKADVSYGKGALSDAQVAALDAMYQKYSDIMDGWNILNHIGRIDVDIDDLFQPDPSADDELNILLIGNSFSFYWVEELYGLLAEGSGYDPDKITITNVYYSGCPLKNHWNWLQDGTAHYNIAVTNANGRSYDKSLLEDLNTVVNGDRARKWDFISLQQNSGAFYSGDYVGDLNYARQTLEPYLGNLLDYLRTYHPKAEYMWHQFWSHEVGHESTSGKLTVSNIADRTAFHDAMVSIGSEVSQLYGMTVVPTGEAWELVRDNTLITTPHSSSNLTAQSLCTRMNSSGGLWDDLYHDGDAGGGQFLNACVWYEKITGKSVLNLTWKPTYTSKGVDFSLSNEQIALLKYAAHAAVAKYTPNEDPSLDNETNILLIGNSFSYHWTDELAGMLTAAGYPNVNVYNVYTSGCTLEQHWTGYQGNLTGFDNNGNGTLESAKDEIIEFRCNNKLIELGRPLFQCITEKNWDMISLQQSGTYVYGTSGSANKFVTNSDPYAKNLLSALRGMFPKAEYYWLQNWAHEIYESGTHSSSTGISSVAERQQIAGIFRSGTDAMCAKYSLTKVPCGDAWELVRDNALVNYGTYDLTSRARPKTTMLTDGRHDGDYCGGQYLNACVWFETITGTSCIGNTFVPGYNNNGATGYLSAAQIALLQNAAHSAVAAVYGANYAK